LLEKAAGNQEVLSLLKDDCSSGFMIHGRFSNFPPQLIVDLHRNLKEDLLWAKNIPKKECEEDKDLEVEVIEKFKKLHRLLLLSPCSFSNENSKPTSSSSSSKSQYQFSNVIGYISFRPFPFFFISLSLSISYPFSLEQEETIFFSIISKMICIFKMQNKLI
jgi:hypothetical protein